jgi:hypothetical protein
MIATSGSSYQLYLNGNTIGSAINEEYVVAQPGNYSVQVTDANGCTATSTSRYINPTGINNITTNQFINVYPNPLQSGNWQLEVSNDWLGSNADLYDASGKAVLHTEIKNLKTELQINIAQGIYLLKVTGNGRSMVKKLVKL